MNMLLHIYAQEIWHEPGYIIGTPEALLSLRDAITAALRTGRGDMESFVCDGEGYTVHVLAVLEAQMHRLVAPYTDPCAQDPDPGKTGPRTLL